MSIVVYSDVIVPNASLEAGLTGSQSRQNTRTMNQGGFASVNVVRDVTMRSWQIQVAPMNTLEAETILALAEVTDFGAFGMLLEDPIDSRAMLAPVLLADDTYQLWKRYTAPGGTRARDRKITRPAVVNLYREGVVMAGGFTVDPDTGVVTIADPEEDTFTWSGTFYVPVHFREDSFNWDLVAAGQRDSRMIAITGCFLDEVRE